MSCPDCGASEGHVAAAPNPKQTGCPQLGLFCPQCGGYRVGEVEWPNPHKIAQCYDCGLVHQNDAIPAPHPHYYPEDN